MNALTTNRHFYFHCKILLFRNNLLSLKVTSDIVIWKFNYEFNLLINLMLTFVIQYLK